MISPQFLGISERSFTATGYSVAANQARNTLSANDQLSEFTSTDGSLAAALSRAGTHVFGALKHASQSIAGTGLQLAVVLNKEYRGGELIAAVARARAIVAARGATVY